MPGASRATDGDRFSLVGRVDELAALEAEAEQAAAGRGRIVIVEGEAGVGKTSVVEEFLEWAEGRGFATFRGRCEELERTRAFGPLFDAFAITAASPDPRRAAIGLALAGASNVTVQTSGLEPVPDVGYQIVQLLIDLVESLASDQPVLLAIDDLHWADPATLRALRSISRRLDQLPAVVVGTMRPLPRPPEVAGALDAMLSAGGGHMVVGPLSASAVTELAKAVLGARPDPEFARQLARAGGNPLFVGELIRALVDEGAVEVGDGVATARFGPAPPSLRLTILRRLSVLPDPTLEVLRIASVLGSTFTLEHLGIVTGLSAVELLSRLDVAIRAGILLDVELRIGFRHDLIREAIYQEIPAAFRAGIHLQVARSLADAGAPITQIAQHVALGATPGDRQAVAWLRKAAAELLYVASSVAVGLLERALELLGRTDPERTAVVTELALPLVFVGRAAEAHRLVGHELARVPDPAVEYQLRRTIAYSFMVGGQLPAAIDEYRIVTGMMPRATALHSAQANHAVDLANFAIALLLSTDLEAAREPSVRALELARTEQDDLAVCVALFPAVLIADAAGDVGRSVELAAEGHGLATDRTGAQLGNLWLHMVLGYTLVDADRLEDAMQVVEVGTRLVQEQGRASQLVLYYMAAAVVAFHAGNWAEAETFVEAALAAGHEADGAGSTLVGCRAVGAMLAYHQGDLTRATEHLQHGEAASPGAIIGLDWLLFAKAMVLETQGDIAQARTTLDTAWDLFASLRYHLGCWRWIAPELVRLAMAGGDTERATRVTETAEEGARRAPDVATAVGAALRCRGLLEGRPGILMESVAALRRGPRPLDRALACEDAALALGRSGRLDEASPLFDEAAGLCEQLGAAGDLARIRAGMRRLGLRRGIRSSPRRPATGWGALTDTERAVTFLVTEGLTNAQIAQRRFVSRYTVETHLKHVFVKLGIASRFELATVAARHTTSSSP